MAVLISGIASVIYRGPWQIPTKVINCLCPDGKRRTIYFTTISPDTFFSHPASMSFKGKRISGYVTGRSIKNENGQYVQDYEFCPYYYGKNFYLVKKFVGVSLFDELHKEWRIIHHINIS